MKKSYQSLVLEMELFDNDDVITASGDTVITEWDNFTD